MKILAVQNRMGIGDTIIFLPFIKALSKEFNSPISILVKENSKADQYLDKTEYIDKILFVERDKHDKKHSGFLGTFNLIKDIKKYNTTPKKTINKMRRLALHFCKPFCT